MRESSLRRIERFNKGIERLRQLENKNLDDFLENEFLQDSLERNLQVCFEAINDIARKIIALKQFRIPKDYKDTIKVLAENKVLSNELANKLIELAKLRNLLVHLYSDIKIDILLSNLGRYVESLEEGMRELLEYCRINKIDP